MRSQLRLKWLNCVNMTLTPRHAFKVLNPSRPGESSSYYPDHFSATTNSISSLTADTKHETWHLSGHVSINTVNKTVIDDQMLSLTLITILTSQPQVSLHCCVLQCYNRQPGPGVRCRYDGEFDVGPGSRHLFEGDYPRVTLELRVTERDRRPGELGLMWSY